MIKEIERTKPPAEASGPAGTWIQITFTLDSEHYRTLWRRAEEEHRTVPSLVRESVVDFLEEITITSPQQKLPSR